MRDFVSLKARTLLAKKPVKRGDVLLTAKPFCFVLESSVIGQYCEYCLASVRKEVLLARCEGCARAWYCSSRCQDLGLSLHQRECVVFRRLPHYKPRDFARFLARLIWKLQDGGDEVAEKIDDKRSRRFKDLVSHIRELKMDRQRLSYLEEMMQDLCILVGKKNLPRYLDLLAIYGRVMVNSFCLLDDHLTPIGTSLYLAASVIDHSCAANAFVSFIGNKLVVRSLIDSPDLDWSMVRISYLDSMDSREQRLSYLIDTYYFTCDCRVCRDENNARIAASVICGRTGCDAPVYLDEKADGGVECLVCGFNDFPDHLHVDYRRIANLTRHHLDELDEECPNLEVWKEVTEAQEGVFHPLNVLRAKALDALLTATINMRGWHTAWSVAKQNHAAIRHYYGPKHPTYGLFLMKLGKIELCNMESYLALDHLKEAEEIMESGLGSNHPLVFDSLTGLLIQATEETKVDIQRSLIYGKISSKQHTMTNRGKS